MKKFAPFFLTAVILAAVTIFFKTQHPCEKTVTYRIGQVDSRFGLSRQEFSNAVAHAASSWNQAAGRAILRENTAGDVEVNLVYDYRQEASDKLKKLNIQIENTKEFYDRMTWQYESLKAEFLQKQASLNDDVKSFSARAAAFQAAVASAGHPGGISEEARQQVLNEQKELNLLRERLQQRDEQLQTMTQTLNSMAVVINEIAGHLNLHVVGYHTAGSALGRQYQQAFYLREGKKQTITVYQFANDQQLTRALTHEFGHALGLEHTNDPQSVMFRLMQSDDPELKPADIAAWRARCKDLTRW